MSIIIPASIDENSVRVPMQFPLRAQDDSVVDANDRCVLTMDDSVAIGESLKFAKLFAKAPLMWELLGDAYIILSAVAASSGVDHGSPDEKDKERCILCRCETLLDSLK
jgi:hypothetical protein